MSDSLCECRRPHVTLHVIGADGVTTGYRADLDQVPQRGEEVLLIDGGGNTERYSVVSVRHVIVKSGYRAGTQSIEVVAE